ncbi:MAG TPA: hypothetical protein VNV88_06815 [Candidatus Solibacter sp.]|jgi:hypothetical protein|nr:hypothetical protein [Candidatus Solibacter sp.]
MKVKPMIGQYEIPGIQRIGTTEDRRLVEIPVPGLEGSLTQDLGSGSVSIHIEGTLAGDGARDGFLDKIREMFKSGQPVDFVADITSATSVDKIMVADLRVQEVAGTTDSFRYAIVLTQFVEPPPAATGFGDLADVNAAVIAEAGQQFKVAQVPDLLNSISNFGDPTPPLKGAVDGVKTAVNSLSGVQGALKGLFGA